MDYLNVGGVQAIGKSYVSVDTGIRLIVGEVNAVKDLMSKIPGSKDGSTNIGPGFYSSALFSYCLGKRFHLHFP
jgi:hypothetical protein